MDLGIGAGQAASLIGLAAIILGVVYVTTSAWPYADRTRFGPGMAILSSVLIVGGYAAFLGRSVVEAILIALVVGAMSMGFYDVAKAIVWHDDEHAHVG